MASKTSPQTASPPPYAVPVAQTPDSDAISMASTKVADPTPAGKWRRRLPSLVPVILFALVYIVLLVLFLVFHTRLLPQIQAFGETVKGLGVGGYFIVGSISMITAFPPIPGYGLSATFAGLVYGWLGIVPVMVGAFIGASLCFLLFRRFGYRYAQRLIASNPKATAIVHAVELEGFKLLFLVRLAPYPFNLFNALFAVSHVSFRSFALATLLTLPKDLLDVGIGTNLDILIDGLFDHPRPLIWGMTIAFGLIAVGVTLWIVWIARRAVRRMEEDKSWREEVNNCVEIERAEEVSEEEVAV